jgi:hypothetical protein
VNSAREIWGYRSPFQGTFRLPALGSRRPVEMFTGSFPDIESGGSANQARAVDEMSKKSAIATQTRAWPSKIDAIGAGVWFWEKIK